MPDDTCPVCGETYTHAGSGRTMTIRHDEAAQERTCAMAVPRDGPAIRTFFHTLEDLQGPDGPGDPEDLAGDERTVYNAVADATADGGTILLAELKGEVAPALSPSETSDAVDALLESGNLEAPESGVLRIADREVAA